MLKRLPYLLAALLLVSPAQAQLFKTDGVPSLYINGTNKTQFYQNGMDFAPHNWLSQHTFALNPIFSGCVGYPYSTGLAPFTCSTTLPTVALGPGAAAASLATNQLSPTDSRYGAKCDGVTVDSASFATTIAASKLTVLPGPMTCIVGNLVITDNAVFDCNGAILRPAPGATWIIKKTGFKSVLKNCTIYDPTNILMQSTTLSAAATPGSTVLPVVSAATFQVNMIASIQLASGAYWTSKITAVNTGANTITIADPIPYTVTAATLATGGANGYVSGDSFVLLNGVGPPATLRLTAASGAVTGVTSVDAPGLYQTSPGSPAVVFDPLTPAAYGATLNMTYAGALSGAFVDAAFGAILIDNAEDGETANIVISAAPVGVELEAVAGQVTQESLRHIDGSGAPIAGLAKLEGVNNVSFREIRLYGTQHHASTYGGVGVYIDGDNQAYASGGNEWDILLLNFETGLLDLNGTLDTFDHATFDTIRNYGGACIGCNDSEWNYLWAAFTGPQAYPGAIAGRGVGMYFGGNAANNAIGVLATSNNATDIHFGDANSSVWINPASWSWSKLITGYTYSLFPPTKLFTISPSAIGGLATPQYLAPGVISATQNSAFTLAGLRGQLTGLTAVATIAPGSATYNFYLQINHWNGVAYTGWNAVGSCPMTGTSTACSYGSSGITVSPQDEIQVSVSSSGGAFVASQVVTLLVNGI